MSISSLMSIGKSAMNASYAQMQATSNNISNANTAGYSRQEVQLAVAGGQQTSVGFFGSGVDVTAVTRSYDQFLTAQANVTNSASAADSSRLDILTQLEGVFTTGTTGIGYAAGQLLNSFVDVANTPSDSSARQVALSQATQLSSMISSAGDQITSLQSGVVQDVKTTLATVNALAQQIASLNKQISAVKSSGQSPNDLLDQRDSLVKQIGGYINVTTVPADDGSLGVFVGGGQNLVLGSTASTLSAMADPTDGTKVQVGLSIGGAAAVPVPSSSITGGSIGGLLKVQGDLTDGSNLLGQMATAISAAMNQQQALGLDLKGNAGAPIFSVADPTATAATTNSGDASISIAVTDASQTQPSDYKLSFDGTNYSLTRLSDNSAVGSPFPPSALASPGVTVDGMTITAGTPAGTPQVGDTFLLRPVGNAAKSMQTVLADPSGIAAAAPFTASVGAANTGTANIGSLVATGGFNPALSASITFGAGGAYTYSLNTTPATTGSGTWTAGNPISINGFALQLSGVPKSGDTVTVSPTTAVTANNGNAQAFVNLADTAMIGGQTVTDAYASAIATIGVRVQSATAASTASTAAAANAETARSNSAGVNLDEEASRLIQFQQSYQAAAKVLQVAQAVFDTLLQSVTS